MIDKILNKIEKTLLYLEQKCGIYFSSITIALFLICIAAIYVTPAFAPMQLGRGYASLSIRPFDFSEQNDLRFRILTPLLAHIVGLRGSLYIVFPTIIAIILLATIYYYLRKNQQPTESLFITMLICFSTPILFLLHFQGYVDVTSYLLILLIIIFIKKPFIWIFLMILLLFNHDSNLFILPSLFYLYYIQRNDKRLLIISLALLIIFIPFYLYRTWVSSLSPVGYDMEMYSSQIVENVKTIAPCFFIGLFYSFKLFWLFPLIAIYVSWNKKNRHQLILFSLLFFGVLLQLLFASDTSRLIGLAFPLIIFSSVKVLQFWGRDLFLKRTFVLILINFLVPQYYVGQSTMIKFYSLPSSYILKHYFGIETWIG